MLRASDGVRSATRALPIGTVSSPAGTSSTLDQSDLGSKNTTGSSQRTASFISALASAAVAGATTTSPGV